MFNLKSDVIAHCKGCNKIMIVKNGKEPLNQYLLDQGFRKTGNYWDRNCFWRMINE